MSLSGSVRACAMRANLFLRSNSHRKLQYRALSSRAGAGLFGMKDMHAPDDFIELANGAVSRCDVIRKELKGRLEREEAPDAELLILLDRISNEVCTVIDAAELCRNVHKSAQYRQSAESAFALLSNYISTLNADPSLYASVNKVCTDPDLWKSLTEEQRLVAKDLKREFEADGIHLHVAAASSGSDKGHTDKKEYKDYKALSARVKVLQSELVEVESFFMQACASDDNHTFQIGPMDNEAHLQAWLGQYVSQDSASEGFAICSSQKPISRAIVASSQSESVRKQAWEGSCAEPASNQCTLGRLIKTRQALAKGLGYESFAHKVLANSVAASPYSGKGNSGGNSSSSTLFEDASGSNANVDGPARVWSFLESASTAVRPFAEKEMGDLSALKRQIVGTGNDAGDNIQINPWDVPYLTQMHRSMHEQGGGGGAREALQEYLPLEVAVDALSDVAHCLFGITLKVLPLPEAEAWLDVQGPRECEGNSEGSKEHTRQILIGGGGAFKLEATGPSGEGLGTVYLDLYNRPDKFTGAAHFTVQCGCDYSGGQDASQAQLPVVALVFNFPSRSGSSAFYDKSPLLSLSDLTTLFHEWGHALHSLLSRTTYQHLSGTRGALDFVEVPSHLFERFATDPRMLKRWARHHSTGSPPPDGLVEQALAERGSFFATEVQAQLLYSLADQYMFGSGIGDCQAYNDAQVYDIAMRGAADLQSRYTLLAVPELGPESGPALGLLPAKQGQGKGMVRPSSLFAPSHSHLITYGGGYYAYLYAKMYAAQIWDLQFEKDPLSRASGERLWKDMLGYGVSRDPKKLLTDLCEGKDLDPTHYYTFLK